MIGAANALLVDATEREGRQPVRAMLTQQAVSPHRVAIDDEFFAENLYRFYGLFLCEFTSNRHRMPVAAQQFSRGRAAADLGEQLVFFSAQHPISLLCASAPATTLHGSILYALLNKLTEPRLQDVF